MGKQLHAQNPQHLKKICDCPVFPALATLTAKFRFQCMKQDISAVSFSPPALIRSGGDGKGDRICIEIKIFWGEDTMKQPDERAVIEAHFKEHWAGLTPVQYENVPFERPSDGPYVSLWVLPEDGRQIASGKEPFWRFDGRIEAALNFPVQKFNPQQQQGYVEKIKNIFRNMTLDGIHIPGEADVSEKEINDWRRTRIAFRMQWEEKSGRRVIP
jgi:hypothetical protein